MRHGRCPPARPFPPFKFESIFHCAVGLVSGSNRVHRKLHVGAPAPARARLHHSYLPSLPPSLLPPDPDGRSAEERTEVSDSAVGGKEGGRDGWTDEGTTPTTDKVESFAACLLHCSPLPSLRPFLPLCLRIGSLARSPARPLARSVAHPSILVICSPNIRIIRRHAIRALPI